jgi:hypothetical protein
MECEYVPVGDSCRAWRIEGVVLVDWSSRNDISMLMEARIWEYIWLRSSPGRRRSGDELALRLVMFSSSGD